MFVERRRSARLLACSLIAGGILALLPSGAMAGAPADVCAEFPHTQSYRRDLGLFRAPAWHYGRPVTIVYEADECTTEDGRPNSVALSVSGTATVYPGLEVTDGKEPLDEKPFSSVLRYDAADGSAEWPVRWWSCKDASFSYVWTIDDVYRFAMRADGGKWSIGQADLAPDGETDGRTINACRLS